MSKPSFSRYRLSFMLGGFLTVIAVLWVVSIAESGQVLSKTKHDDAPGSLSNRPIPAHALKAAGGKFGDMTWGVWLFGNHRGNCWATKVVEDGFPSESAYCGSSVPPRPWSLAVRAPLGKASTRRTVLFFLTRADIARLRVLTQQLSASGQQVGVTSRNVRTHAITDGQAEKARLHEKFGFAVDITRGWVCIKRVTAFDRTGSEIANSPLFRCKD